MPPLLAAFLVLEFGCGLTIIKAIDLSQEWFKYAKSKGYNSKFYQSHSDNWYNGFVGIDDQKYLSGPDTFVWPKPHYRSLKYEPRLYAK